MNDETIEVAENSTTGIAGLEGSAPILTIGITEHEKYRRLWADHPEYRVVAPGESIAPMFLEVVRPKPNSEVIDFGAGTGRGALALALFGGCVVTMLDFVDGSLDVDVKNATITQPTRLKFLQHNLRKPIPISAPLGYCTDVMEHIPPDDVGLVLFNVLKSAQHVFFQISCEDDVCGKLIGHPLHLSVHPFAWWLDRFKDLGCVVHYSKDFGSHCVFYVSSWRSAKEVVDIGELNTEQAQILANVKTNISRGFQQIFPHMTNTQDIMILGGGPSMAGRINTIKQLVSEGVKVVAVNGAYQWALDQGLQVGAMVMVDAREFNKRFVANVQDKCKYLIASQCHPSVLDQLPKDSTYLFHTAAEYIRKELDAMYDIWFGTPGGSTVVLRAIPLLRMMGFRRMHLFGFDSCLADDLSHHLYAQPENDSDAVINVIVNGGPDAKRVFKCHAWMLSQAQEFMDLVKFLGDEIELEVYGDGLIAWILKTGASAADLQPSDNFELS